MRDRILGHNEEALHVLRQELAKRFNYVWMCANGSMVNVKDMTTSHLVYAIDKLEAYLAQQAVIRENCADATDYYD